MASTMKDSGPYAPTKSTTVADTHSFSVVNTMAQEYTFDRVYHSIPLQVSQFGCTTAAIVTLVSGACVLSEVNTTGIAGIVLDTSKDQIAFSFVTPIDMDPSKEFAIRYEFANRTGIKWTKASDLVTTSTKWSAWKQSTSTGAIAATMMSDTTNTTSIPSVVYGRCWSDWDSVNDSAVLAAGVVPGDTRINIMTDFTLATNVTSIFVLGIQLGYYKRYQM